MGCRQGKLECKKDETAPSDGAAAEDGQTNPAATAADDQSSAKVIVVFGNSALDGGSVARCFKDDDKFKVKVRVVSRQADESSDKEATKQTEQESVFEIVQADLDDKESLKKVFEGAYGVFLATKNADPDTETLQGKNVVDVAKDCNIQHLVYCGSESVKDLINKDCKELESKATIEKYMIEQNVPFTIVRFATDYSSLLADEAMKPKKNDNGEYVIDIPMGDEAFDMINVAETGECIHQIFLRPSEFLGKTLGLSAQRFKLEEYAANLSKAVDGMKFIAGTTSLEDFAKLEMKGVSEWSAICELYKNGKCERDIELTRKLNPAISTFEQWVDNNREGFENNVKS